MTFEVTASRGRIPIDLHRALTQLIDRSGIEARLSQSEGKFLVNMLSSSDAECRFILKLLLNAGYEVAITDS